MGNVAGEQGLALQQHFPYKPPVVKSHLLMMGASNLAILIFSTCISPQKGLKFPGWVGGSVRPKKFKKCIKLNWNFQRGGGS